LSFTQTGNPLAPLAYGQQLGKIAALEQEFRSSPKEQEVLRQYAERARVLGEKLEDVDAALLKDRLFLRAELHRQLGGQGDELHSQALRKALASLPKDRIAAREQWSRERADYLERSRPLAGMPAHSTAFAGDPDGSPKEQADFTTSRANFLALMFCLMVGTAGLPHLLTRYYTTPSVAEARRSVAWSLFFIALLYLSAPALAVLVKYEVMAHLVGQPMDALPAWVAQWARDPLLLTVQDVNGDGILQFAELRMGQDLVVLATPEIGGLPYVVSVLVAAGGLAAALSTADGLLLTIGNALAHDVYFEGNSNRAQAMRRVMWSKFALLIVALVAAYVAAQTPAGILYLVSASFSLAGAAFVPAMVLGIFWPRMTRVGAVGGMLTGLGVTVYYMVINLPATRQFFGLAADTGLWWSIQPISAGVFGVPAGFVAGVLLSWVSHPEPVPERDLAPDLG
jgi:cation/acetate symporter